MLVHSCFMRSHCIFALLILLFLMSLVFSGSSTHLHSLVTLFLDAGHLCSFTVTSYANSVPCPRLPVSLPSPHGPSLDHCSWTHSSLILTRTASTTSPHTTLCPPTSKTQKINFFTYLTITSTPPDASLPLLQ